MATLVRGQGCAATREPQRQGLPGVNPGDEEPHARVCYLEATAGWHPAATFPNVLGRAPGGLFEKVF